MKNIFLIITLLSILAMLLSANFAQGVRSQGDAETFWKQMFEQLEKRQFPQIMRTIEVWDLPIIGRAMFCWI